MSKSHVLLWSGGFDSTAILLSMVSNPETFTDVRVIGCGLTNTNNYAEDKAARKKIAEILSIPNKNISYVEQELTSECRCGIQMPMWAWLSAVNAGHGDDVSMVYGYIRGDDFWHNKYEFEQTVRFMVSLYSEGKISFFYPLEWLSKKEFVSWYLHYPEVFQSISWGGDTATVKAKEKEELEFLYEQLRKAQKEGVKKDENEEIKPKVEREDLSHITIESVAVANEAKADVANGI